MSTQPDTSDAKSKFQQWFGQDTIGRYVVGFVIGIGLLAWFLISLRQSDVDIEDRSKQQFNSQCIQVGGTEIPYATKDKACLSRDGFTILFKESDIWEANNR